MLVLVGVGCGEKDLTGTVVEGCTTDCRPGSIERAVLGKRIAAYQANRVIGIDGNNLDVMDENFETIDRVSLDIEGNQMIMDVDPWLEDSLLVTVGEGIYGFGALELWVIGPDLELQRTVTVEGRTRLGFALMRDLVVEGRYEGTQANPAIVRASRLGDSAPLWTFGHANIVSIERVAASTEGAVIASGRFIGDLDLGTGVVLTQQMTQFGVFTVKLDATGNVLWVRGDYRTAPVAFRTGETIVGNGQSIVTLDDNGDVVSTVVLEPMQGPMYPSSILVDETSVFVAGTEGDGPEDDLFLADVSGSFLMRGNHQDRGESNLRIAGMNTQSIFGSLEQVNGFECGECAAPTYTVDGVSILGTAAVRLHR